MMNVRNFRNILFALLAVLWLPTSVHCQLETVPGFEFLRCDFGNQSSKDDCNNSGCCTVEKSQYRSEHAPLTPPLPDPSLMPLTALASVANVLPAEVSLGILTAAPPQLLKTWHFVSRAALPARAPSIAS